MSEMNGNVPLLGPKNGKTKAQVPRANPLIRRLDENGLVEPEEVKIINGQAVAFLGRSNLVDAEDLIGMIIDAQEAQIGRIVRDELKKALQNK